MAVDAGNIRVILSADTAKLSQGLAVASRLIGGFGTTSGRQLGVASNAMSGLEQATSKMSGKMVLGGVAAVALAAGVAKSVKAAVEFETAWTGALKTLDGSEAQLSSLRMELFNMSSDMPATAMELAAIAEAAGQLGVRVDDVGEFTEVMAQLGATTNLAATEAATSMARFMNVMGSAPQEVDALSSVLVELGNNYAATESEILNLTTRMSAGAAVVGITEGTVLGLAAAMKDLGLPTEAAGTAMQKTFLTIEDSVQTGGRALEDFATVAGMTADEFARLWETDADAAFMNFVEGLSDISAEGGNVVGTLDTLSLSNERTRATLLTLAEGFSTMESAVADSNAELLNASARQEEYEKRLDTTAARWDILLGKYENLAIVVGQIVMPVVDLGLDAALWQVDKLRDGILNLVALTNEVGEALNPPAQDFTPMASLPIGSFDPAFYEDRWNESYSYGSSAENGWAGALAAETPVREERVLYTAEEQAADARRVWETEQAALAAAEGLRQMAQAGDAFAFPDAGSFGIDTVGAQAEDASRSINTMNDSLRTLSDTINEIQGRQDLFTQQSEYLREAEQAAAEAVASFEAGSLSVEELASAFGDLNIAYAQSGVTAEQALAKQDEIVATFGELAAEAGTSAVEIATLTGQFIKLSNVDISKLSEEGLQGWAAVQEQLGQAAALAVELDGTEVVMDIAADTGMTEQQITDLIFIGDEWAQSEWEARMTAETALARENIGMLQNDLQVFTAQEWRTYIDADGSMARQEFANVMLLSGMWSQQEAVAYINADSSQADATFAAEMVNLGLWDTAEAIAFLGAEADTAQIEAFIGLLDDVPDSKDVEVDGEADAAEIQRFKDILDTLQDRNITVRGVAYWSNGGLVGGSGGYGESVLARGGVLTYAEGDVANGHAPEITSPGAPIRVWSEPETQGEAYIPLANDHRRPRARNILRETARRLGMGQHDFAMGGLVDSFANGGATFATSVGLPSIAVTVAVDAEALGQVGVDLAPVANTLYDIGEAATTGTVSVAALGASFLGTRADGEELKSSLGGTASAIRGTADEIGGFGESLVKPWTDSFRGAADEIGGFGESLVDAWTDSARGAADEIGGFGESLVKPWNDSFKGISENSESTFKGITENLRNTGRDMALAMDEQVFIDKFSAISGWAEESFVEWLGAWDLSVVEMVVRLEAAGLELDHIWGGMAEGAGVSAAEMFNAFNDSALDISEAAQELGRGMAEGMDPEQFIAIFSDITGWASEAFVEWLDDWDGTVNDALSQLEDAGLDIGFIFEEMFARGAEPAEVLAVAIGTISESLQDVEDAASAAGNALDVLYGRQLDLIGSQIDYLNAIDEVNAIVDEGGVFGFDDKEARRNLESLIQAGQDMEAYGREVASTADSADDAVGSYRNLEQQFADLATAAGLPAEEVAELTTALFGIPDQMIIDIQVEGEDFEADVEAYEGALEELGMEPTTVTIEADTEESQADIEAAVEQLEELVDGEYVAEIELEKEELETDLAEVDEALATTTEEDYIVELEMEREALLTDLEDTVALLEDLTLEPYEVELELERELFLIDIEDTVTILDELTAEPYEIVFEADTEELDVALEDLETELLAFEEEPTTIVLELDADDAMDALTGEGGVISELEAAVAEPYEATLTVDVEDATTEILDLTTLATTYAEGTYDAEMTATDSASEVIGTAQAAADGFVAGSPYHAVLTAESGQAVSAISAATGALAGFTSKSITVTTTQQTVVAAPIVLGSSSDQAKRFADGGFENHVAQIAPAGAYRLWAEAETGGEAYIPLSPQKRDRSMEILSEVASLFGHSLVPMANGGVINNLTANRGGIVVNAPVEVNVSGGASVETARIAGEAAERAVDGLAHKLERKLARR